MNENVDPNQTPLTASTSTAGPAGTPADTPTFVHRASGASVIAAKKHTRKRPLGSHAPLARKPSLPHAFEFPSSPVKAKPLARAASGELEGERPALRRRLSNASAGEGVAKGAVMVDGRRQVAAGLRMFSNEPVRARAGGTVWASDGGSMALVEESTGSSDGPEEVDRVHAIKLSSDDADASHKDDGTAGAALWSHMMSDPPSERDLFSSPVPLTRKRMLAMAESTFGNPRATSVPTLATPTDRPRKSLTGAKRHTQGSHGRAPSLGNILPSRSGGAAEASRAGGEDTCALGALERQFVRMGKEPGLAGRGAGSDLAVGMVMKLEDEGEGSEEEDELDEDEEVGRGGLLWGARGASAGSPERVSAVKALEGLQEVRVKREGTGMGNADERECAELLLGLGGAFF